MMKVDRRIEAHTRATPQANAISFDGGNLTFGELDSLATRYADQLRETGVGRGDLVGLYGNRSPSAVVALLAILKTGAAYLPLDRNHPQKYLARIVNEARVRVVVDPDARDSRSQSGSIDPIRLHIAEVLPRNAGATPYPACEANEDVAAVLYTSGSEGSPKGVVVSHRAILARSTESAVVNAENNIVCVTSPVTSIGHVSSLLVPLLSGRQVLIVSDSDALSLRRLAQITERCGVSGLPMVPSQFRSLLNDRQALSQFGHIRAIVLRAEPISPELVRLAQDRLPNASLFNAYGATETTGLVSFSRIDSPDVVAISTTGLSRYMHILEGDESVPIGEVGELCVTGPQLASGYLNDPELTARRFTTGSLSNPGELIYRTGDMARCSHSGVVEIMGRSDQQVKVLGFRVNLADVESCIQRIPMVSRAVVLIQERRINAYVEARLDPLLIRSELRAELPGYMQPDTVTVVSEFPVLPSGKIDRCALQPVVSQVGIGPQARSATRSEETVARFWCEALETAQVDKSDDFFEIGGDSLSAMELLCKIEDHFGIELDMEDLIHSPTIEELARLLEQRLDNDRYSHAP